jgi:ferritin-like metal-binding protein YciE
MLRERKLDEQGFLATMRPLFFMGKQYNKVIKRQRARAYEQRVKERVHKAIAAAKKRK